jgi:hypothetical protein
MGIVLPGLWQQIICHPTTGEYSPDFFARKKYFRRVTDSPARYRMNRRAALSASKPRTRRRSSMFNVNIQMEKYKYENQNKRQSGVANSSASAARPE